MSDQSTTTQPTCADRVERALASRLEDLEPLWAGLQGGLESVSTYTATCPHCGERAETVEESEADEFHCSECFEEIDKADAPDWSEEYHGSLYEYGLCFDYVEPDTFDDQPYGYWCYQISCGGPSEEFRLLGGGQVQFWFLDWFDGAPLYLRGETLDLLRGIFDWFLDCEEERHGF